MEKVIETCTEENRIWGRVLQLLQQGRSREEIREELGGIAMASVYTRIHRARKRLSEILKEDFDLDLKDWSRRG